MVTLGDSGVMIFYPGEPRITASMNGEGWKVPGIRSGPLFHAGVYGVGSWGTREPPVPSKVLSFTVSIYIQYTLEDGLGWHLGLLGLMFWIDHSVGLEADLATFGFTPRKHSQVPWGFCLGGCSDDWIVYPCIKMVYSITKGPCCLPRGVPLQCYYLVAGTHSQLHRSWCLALGGAARAAQPTCSGVSANCKPKKDI